MSDGETQMDVLRYDEIPLLVGRLQAVAYSWAYKVQAGGGRKPADSWDVVLLLCVGGMKVRPTTRIVVVKDMDPKHVSSFVGNVNALREPEDQVVLFERPRDGDLTLAEFQDIWRELDRSGPGPSPAAPVN